MSELRLTTTRAARVVERQRGSVSTRDMRPVDRRRGRALYGPDDDYTPEQLAAMSRDELDRLGARYDGVEILHVDPGPEPGSPLEKRADPPGRHWSSPSPGCSPSSSWSSTSARAGSSPTGSGRSPRAAGARFFTPLLGLLMGLSLLCVGVGLVLFTKKLLPHETAVQDKHDGSHFDRVTAGATLVRRLPQQRARPAQADHPLAAAHGRRRRASC